MSVLSNSTHFNLSNNTSKFLEITVSVDQQSSFRIYHNSSHIIEVPRKTIEHATYASWFVDTATCWTRGRSMEMVKVNMPPKVTIECDISCSGALELNTSIKERNSLENTNGILTVPPENQGCELHIIYTEEKGLGYTIKGDVAIGLGDLASHTIFVNSIVKTMDGHVIDIEDNIPSMCKLSI